MFEAIWWLAIARIWLVMTHFRNVAGHLGTASSPGTTPVVPIPETDRLIAAQVGRAILIAAKIVPFRAVCLQQAVAGKLMLRRRHIASTLHFGVARAEAPTNKMEAHAWLDAGDIKVSGYPLEARWTEVAQFA